MVYRRGVVFDFEVGARASKLTLVVKREIESSLTMLSYLISTIYVNQFPALGLRPTAL
jgi:hypothetical protein